MKKMIKYLGKCLIRLAVLVRNAMKRRRSQPNYKVLEDILFI